MTDKVSPKKSKKRSRDRHSDGTPKKTRKLKKTLLDESDGIFSTATDSSIISHASKSPGKHSRKKSDSLSNTELEISVKSKHRHKDETTCESPSKFTKKGRQSVESMSSAGESDTDGQLSPIIPNTNEPQLVSFSSLKSKTHRSPRSSRTGGKKRPISSALILDSSGSEDDAGHNSQEEAIIDTPKRRMRSPVEGDEDLFEDGDLMVHALNGNAEDFSLWLIKAPAEMSLKSMPQNVMVEEITNFKKKKNTFEVRAFSDETMQTDYLSWVKNESGGLSLGPKISGQIHFMDLPAEQPQGQGRATRALIVSKPVPFPSGLKARFQPFGADAPVVSSKKRKKSLSELESSVSMATDQIDGIVLKKKKKKKKHKHDVK